MAFRSPRTRRALIFAAVLSATAPVWADKNWKSSVVNGNWNTAANWIEGAVPNGSDNVIISVNDALAHTVTYDASSFSSNSALGIRNFNHAGAATLSIGSNNSLTVGWCTVGASGVGAINQSAGTFTPQSYLDLGDQVGGIGTYTMSGGTLHVGGGGGQNGFYIGDAGTGNMQQSDGLVTTTVPLYVANQAGSAGTYELEGILNTTNTDLIGVNGAGAFIQNDGTLHLTNASNPFALLGVGWNSTAVGTYSLGFGSLVSDCDEDIGVDGKGNFIQTGGNNSANTLLTLGYDATGAGTYSMQSIGSFALANTLTAHGIVVGSHGAGTFIENGGTVTIPSNGAGLSIGNQSDGSGTFLMQHGTLSVNASTTSFLTVGDQGRGTFNQTGGVVATSTLTIGNASGGTGTYLLGSNGVLNIVLPNPANPSSSGINVGSASGSSGYMKISGGTLNMTSVSSQRLDIGKSGSGTVEMTGGVINSSSGGFIIGVGGANGGTFAQSGGTVNVVGLLVGITGSGSGTYSISDGTLHALKSIAVNGASGDAGTFSQNGGTVLCGSEGTLSEGVILETFDDGATASYLLSNGFLSASSLSVGERGSGRFVQSGGTCSPGTLTIAASNASSGSYSLGPGGTLTPSWEYIGLHGAATFVQTGGLNSSAAYVDLGIYPGAAGTYSLNAGTLNFPDAMDIGADGIDGTSGDGTLLVSGGAVSAPSGIMYVGYGGGKGYISQNAGTVNVAYIAVGDDPISAGTLNLSGTGLFKCSYLDVGGWDEGSGDAGVVNISGGTMAVSSVLRLFNTGAVAPGGASLSLSGGYLSVATLNTNNNPARFNWTGGQFVVINNSGLLIDANSQIGSSPNIATGMGLGVNATLSIGSGGTVTLSGGSITTSALTISSGGTFSQTSGTLTTGSGGPAPLNGGVNVFNNGYFSSTGGSADIAGITGSGTVTLAPGQSLTVNSFQQSVLNVSGKMTVRPSAQGGALSQVGSLTINNGTLDLNDNDLIATLSSYAYISGQIRNARDGALWDKTGITSTVAATAFPKITTLGAMTGQEFHSIPSKGPLFDNQSVANTDVLVMYTYLGDADFNGKVDGSDYARMDLTFAREATQGNIAGWVNGDFDYNGKVDGSDYALADLGFTGQTGTLARALAFLDGDDPSMAGMDAPALQLVAEHFSEFGQMYADTFITTVPEPTAFAFAAAGAGIILRRRRRAALSFET